MAFAETRITPLTLAADNLMVKASAARPERQRSESGGRDRMLDNCSSEDVDRVAAAVLAGEVVAYPTETFYALGADARRAMRGRLCGLPCMLRFNLNDT